jgi:hypothetical protein
MEPEGRRVEPARKARGRKPREATLRDSPPRILQLTPERVLDHAARRFVDPATTRCPKCGSTFVDREPAFVHCRYCGKMARIADASLAAQEVFELRSGLRLAS